MRTLYFGYGSNLATDDVRRWCGEHDMPPGTLSPVSRAWWPDMEPCFHYRSKARSGGALDVRPAPGRAVPGMVFEADEDALRALDAKEGASSRTGKYERVTARVIVEGGGLVDAVSYRVRPQFREPRHVPPTAAYVEVVRRGLAAHGIPDGPLLHAAEGRPVPPIGHLFVYGTLMTGECRQHLLDAHAPSGVMEARVRGRLIELGDYPGLTLAPPGDAAWVRGEMWSFEEVAALLRTLDDVEDFRGYERPGSLYERTLVRAEGHTAMAWTYVYVGRAAGPVIESGDWRRR